MTLDQRANKVVRRERFSLKDVQEKGGQIVKALEIGEVASVGMAKVPQHFLQVEVAKTR